MPDPRLYELIHGLSEKKQSSEAEVDRFQKAIDDSIAKHVEMLILEEDPKNLQFYSQNTLRTKLAHEMQEQSELPELESCLFKAVEILQMEGANYLGTNVYEHLLSELDGLRHRIAAIDPNHIDSDTVKAALTVSTAAFSSILEIGVSKYIEGQFSDSMAIFAMLTTLDSEDPDYWYRLGLAAQKAECYELAARAYLMAANLSPGFIGAHVFAGQCLHKSGLDQQAADQIAEIKKIAADTQIDQDWEILAAALETQILTERL